MFVAFPIFGLIGLVLLASLVGVVAMVIHPKTRVVGVALLAIGGVMVAIAVVSFLCLTPMRRTAEDMQMEVQFEDGAAHRTMEAEYDQPVPVDPSGKTPDLPAPAGSDSSTAAVLKEETEAPPSPRIPAAAAPPTWVGQGPGSVGNTYQVAVDVGPCSSLAKCEAELPAAVERAVARYVDETLGHGPRIAAQVQLPANFIRNNNIVQERWTEPFVFDKPIAGDDATWTQLHVLLVLDAKARRQIEQQCKSVIVAGRLWYTGTGVAALLAVLTVLFGCLRIDQVTAGSHRGLLVTAAVLAVAAIAAGGYFALRPIAAESVATPAPAFDVAPVEPAGDGGAEADEISSVQAMVARTRSLRMHWIATVVVGLLTLMFAVKRTRRAAVFVLVFLVLAGVVVCA